MSNLLEVKGFHDVRTRKSVGTPIYTDRVDTKFTYRFRNFFHPYVGELIAELNKDSLTGLLDPKFQARLHETFFDATYTPLPGDVVAVESEEKQLEFELGQPHSWCHWELFYFIPLAIGVHLGKHRRYAEAQRWFRHLLDPTCNDLSIPEPQRFWKFLPFRRNENVQNIGDLLALLSKPDAECDAAELESKMSVLQGYDASIKYPFQPHRIARTRTIAYQYYAAMKYFDLLQEWSDDLLTQNTSESIAQATQLLTLLSNMLGARPQQIPARGTIKPKSYAQLKQAALDVTGNALVELEGQFPFNFSTPSAKPGDDAAASGALFGIGRALYFCAPRNEKLLAYWDTVADRLFKIRHCMDIHGVVQQLPLFDPPIDPGMLVKATAAGIDISSAVSGLNQPVGPTRSVFLIQKAIELSAEVRSLGGALLDALEKGDAAHLTILRQQHEIRMQQLSQDVRFLQWKQAEEASESLLRSRVSALERYRYYLRMLGATPDGSLAPESFSLDRRVLTEDNFDDAHAALVGQYDKAIGSLPQGRLQLAGDASSAIQAGASGAGRLFLNANEDAELNTHLPTARDTRLAASVADTISTILTFIPEFNVNLHFWGLGASSKLFGGSKLSDAAKIAAEILRTVSAWEQDQAGMASRTASYERRADDWIFQSNLAARELVHIGRQIIGSLIAEQVARHEYLNVQKQIENSQEVDLFLHEQFTNEPFHLWRQGELFRLYYEYYRFAVDTARKAEQAMKRELMRPELDGVDFVKFNYWDGGRKGLLSGEALHLDLKRMELAYHESNKREYELTKSISLRQLDPLALLKLKVTGSCEVSVPEWFFNLHTPRLYMLRLKTVAVSIPSLVSAYVGVHCTVSLLRSSVRISPLPGATYARGVASDARFVDYLGPAQPILTSGATTDTGTFESNLHDELTPPFWGTGAISTWRLEFDTRFPAFPLSTISDVILQFRLTARDGGELLGTAATDAVQTMLSDAKQGGLALMFSLRHDFPTEWAAFAKGAGDLALTTRKDYFPYFVQGDQIQIQTLELYVARDGKLVRRTVTAPATAADDLNGEKGSFELPLAADPTVLKRDASDVFLIIRYSI